MGSCRNSAANAFTFQKAAATASLTFGGSAVSPPAVSSVVSTLAFEGPTKATIGYTVKAVYPKFASLSFAWQ